VDRQRDACDRRDSDRCPVTDPASGLLVTRHVELASLNKCKINRWVMNAHSSAEDTAEMGLFSMKRGSAVATRSSA